MKHKLPEDLSADQIEDHPILKRVLTKLEDALEEGSETTSHTAHNSHYSSLAKNKDEK